MPAVGQVILQEQQIEVPTEVFYTEGSEELKAARAEIARFSLRKAAHRIHTVKRRREDPEERMVSVVCAGKNSPGLSH